ncbi:MAG TPA: Gfo/Idh/MocA family oxidoreductase [Planctomycetes bacterium]|nr:Gfo/Idh/MocA family oxidoreductase [Planctomycetota bacterium]
MQEIINLGIIGGGMMGREMASAAARWCHLVDFPVKPVVTSVASRTEKSCRWFTDNISSVRFASADYRRLLERSDVDAVYCAVPHNLHRQIYVDVIRSGRHLLGEKPFGMDAADNKAILDALIEHPSVTARCVSQFPFFPGAQRIVRAIRENRFGRIIEVEAGFLHGSDLDPEKPINWKRIVETNGEYGCMGDLGMHVLHVPLRFGWYPAAVHAVLSNIRPERKNSTGEWVTCDTWDNATLLIEVKAPAGSFPMTLKFQRIAPGETNTWYLNVIGDRYSARFSLKQPRTLRTLSYEPGGPQAWMHEDLGYASVYPAITGGIFEFGFADAVQQMLGAFLHRVHVGQSAEVPFDCATPEETRLHHSILTAALQSHKERKVVAL